MVVDMACRCEQIAVAACLGVCVGMLLMRFLCRLEVRRTRADWRECWDYSCRLLDSPAYYQSERGVLDALGLPRRGVYGRLPDEVSAWSPPGSEG